MWLNLRSLKIYRNELYLKNKIERTTFHNRLDLYNGFEFNRLPNLCILVGDDVHRDVAVVLLERVDDVEEEEGLAGVHGGEDLAQAFVVQVEVHL